MVMNVVMFLVLLLIMVLMLVLVVLMIWRLHLIAVAVHLSIIDELLVWDLHHRIVSEICLIVSTACYDLDEYQMEHFWTLYCLYFVINFQTTAVVRG